MSTEQRASEPLVDSELEEAPASHGAAMSSPRMKKAQTIRWGIQFLLLSPILANPNGVGQLPPMGWSGYNALMQNSGECALAAAYNETTFLETAAALTASGLARLGYDTLSADDCWLAVNRTADGRLAADPTRFPHGMAYLADRLHSQGLKLGLYAAASLLTCRDFPGSQGFEALDAETYAG